MKPDLIRYACDNRGVYNIPKYFAESIQRHKVRGVSAEDFDILEAGPGHESYWDAWTHVCDHATVVDTNCTYRLHQDGDQDGDLWLVPVDMEWNEDLDCWEYPFEGESFTGPACWAPYLIYGDASGLSAVDKLDCDNAADEMGQCVAAIDVGFIRRPDYGMAGECCECCEYRFQSK